MSAAPINSPLRDLLEVILITYNRSGDLDATLQQLRNSPVAQCRFTVIDNASTDATPAICAKHAPHFPDFHIKRNRFNVGVSGNYLRAVETAQKEYAWIVCDDDDYDFTHFDEVVTALASRKFDVISLGAQNHTVLPRGVEVRARDLVRQPQYNYLYTSSFIPCTIYRTSTLKPETVLRGYYNIHTLFSHLFYFADTVRQNCLLYVTKNNFINNRQENVGYRPLHLVVGWLLVANELKKDNRLAARAMMNELLGRHFYPAKIAQYTFLQRGFANQNTARDAWRITVECWKAGLLWFLKVLPFVGVLCLPGFVSRWLWRGCEKIVEAKEGRKIKRPSRIEFEPGKEYRG